MEREIALEKKGIHALKSYLAVRPESISERVFLNYQGEPISERGIRKLVVKYRKEAGITKKAILSYPPAYVRDLQGREGGLGVPIAAVVGSCEFEHDTDLCAFWQTERQKDHAGHKFMRYRFNRGYRYQTHQPAESAVESPDGQYRDRSCQYAAVDGSTQRSGQYVTQRRRVPLLRAGKYQTEEDS